MQNEYLDLLQEWCDSLVSLQITSVKDPELYGGILCPACARIHGRCADAVYPMMTMYDKTKDQKYLDCAKALFDWADYNMTRPDGSFINDTNSAWRGITVFTTIQLGEALLYHGNLLDLQTRRKWTRRVDRAAEFLYGFIEGVHANVNYPITCAASLAVAAKVTGKGSYQEKACTLAHAALQYMTEEGLLYGEGHPVEEISPKGCRPVDLGYNVEESLPGLVTYAFVSGDHSILQQVKDSMSAHLAFMLPDGAWDNSWGNRSAKWTYWGSRTSDGCQIGYGRLAKEIPLFGEAAHRNFQLYRRCTAGGLLHGGPMYAAAQEPPCVHHTFCHAKAVASMVDEGFERPAGNRLLPREAVKGVQFFPSSRVWLLAKGDYRATVSDYDLDSIASGHAKGGALTMLWHPKTGPLCAASMTEYQMVEANNMQLPQYYENICQTPRIEYADGETYYRSINDKTALVTVEESDSITVQAKGVLRDGRQNGSCPFSVRYELSDSGIVFVVSAEAEHAVFRLPVIASAQNAVSLQDGAASVQLENARMQLASSEPLWINEDIPGRTFNPVGGFLTVQFAVSLTKGKEARISLQIE